MLVGVSYLLRVILPDRPGMLGVVAGAIGSAGGDIVGVDVVEHRPDGRAVDDFLVALPAGRMPDSLVSACRTVDGVAVEFIGHYSPGAHLHRDLEAVEAMTSEPDRAIEVLVGLLPGVFRSGWAILGTAQDARTFRVESGAGGAPETSGFDAPWLPLTGPARLDTDGAWAPDSWSDAVAAAVPVPDTDRLIVFGRDGGPRILDSELARLSHLIGLASTIVGQPPRDDLDTAAPLVDARAAEAEQHSAPPVGTARG